MAYLLLDDFADYVDSELSGDRGLLQMALSAAEAAINDYCGRNFNPPSGSATSRTYVPCGDLVVVHDISDATGLTVTENGATVASSQYQLEPTTVSWVGTAQPYYQIRRLWCVPWYTFGSQATVTVNTAKWGWASVPAQVVEATAILAKDLAHLRANRFGVAGFGEFGVVRVRDNPHVTMLLSSLRHPMAYGIG